MTFSGKDYLKSRLKELDFDKKKMYNKSEYKLYVEKTFSNSSYSSYQRTVQKVFVEIQNDMDDNDLLSDNIVSLEASKQKLQDKNRINIKINREQNRLYNALETYYLEFLSLLKENSFKFENKKSINYKESDKILIVQLSDLHIGENVDLEFNKFNYEIAGKRLKLYSSKIKDYCVFYRIKKIIILGTGDFVNNDTIRVLDKLLTNSDNRTKVQFIASYLLSQFINELSTYCNIDIALTVGNESRVLDTLEMPNTEPLLSHNYDYSIFNILKILFRHNENINFLNTPIDEAIIEIYNHKFLVCHGHNINADNTKSVDALLRNYQKKGIIIDYILCGHIHETLIKNFIIRSGSLVGANTYSESKNFSSIASQNLLIVDNKSVTPIPMNLQNTDDILDGYDYPRDIEEYSNMFDKKEKKETAILTIVI